MLIMSQTFISKTSISARELIDKLEVAIEKYGNLPIFMESKRFDEPIEGIWYLDEVRFYYEATEFPNRLVLG